MVDRVLERTFTTTATIADSASLSGVVTPPAGCTLLAVQAVSLTAGSAYLLFTALVSGSTYGALYDGESGQYKVLVTAAAVSVAAVDPSILAGVTSFKVEAVQSDGSTSQAQTGAKTVTFVWGVVLEGP
jgi:hypothetical protein